MSLSILLLFASILAICYAAFNFFKVKKLEEGNPLMQKIASYIRGGANTFMNIEYKVLSIVVIVVAAIVWLSLDWYVAVALLIGSFMSATAGLVGMKIATYANVRVTNEANTTKNIGKTLKVAFRGGSVMGLCVAGFALFGLVIVYIVFGRLLGWVESMDVAKCWLTKIEIIRFPNVLSGYALGCSLVAMFNRVGGGIYTKAADMGADLVGKTEVHIPEDDPRNPATIADNVGDNVGDVAGLGSDLLESYVASIVAAIALGYNIIKHAGVAESALTALYTFPLAFAAIGLIACVLGVASLLVRNLSKSKKVHAQLNGATWFGAGVTFVAGFILSIYLFKDVELTNLGFRLGAASPWVGAAVGIVAGILIGIFAEYYTSSDYMPTKILAEASKEGPALTITTGLALGMRSCMAPCIILGLGIIVSYYLSGLYGVAMSAMGMLSFVALTVSVDTYGPISDNAGGIAEMSELPQDVRNITDTLDAVGNTTAAIGKGFAIGSGGLAALALMLSYMYSLPGESIVNGLPTLNIMEPMTLAGAIVGGALPFLFSGMLIDAVAVAARKMVDEVRRQFKEHPGILEKKEDPDHNQCIKISTEGAINQMKVPALMAVVIPVVCGLLFGAHFVGGILIGSTICSIMIAVFTGNAGGAWDNGKKYIEQGGIPGTGKGTAVHDAAIVGDTVGDPLKDTVGPCMDIFIKIMSTVSLVAVSVFAEYNLWSFIFN
ncbi:sodium-translocating pyrophosphatase [Treponema pectinovorum]|uniref:sodium-translocating pyrophosphatase n=1 Tax=Treponema pectinovorum TaxID=164 RepID=UPI0011CC389C|nr:sodium-translocating pyrophosphatase [Treponema pectinovorum]